MDALSVKKYKPVHETCKTLVNVPVICCIAEGEKEQGWLQWSGENDRMDGQFQFLFPLLYEHPANFMGHPEWFRIVFVDKVKNWINPNARAEMIKRLGDGNPEQYIVYALTPDIVMKYSSGFGPATFVSPIALLGDPNVGVIYPKSYLNMDVNTEEIEKAQRKAQSKGK